MLTQAERAESERQSLERCADFETTVSEIIYAGLDGGSYPPVFDADGKLWPIPPPQMTVADILAFVHNRFGELFVGFCRRMDNFIIH
jgi:hypothetical protein